MAKQKRNLRQEKRVLLLSDTHCGSYIGLTPPHEWLPQYQPHLCDPNSYAFRQGKLPGTDNFVEQDIGGWVAMPGEHFDALMDALEGCQGEEKHE